MGYMAESHQHEQELAYSKKLQSPSISQSEEVSRMIPMRRQSRLRADLSSKHDRNNPSQEHRENNRRDEDAAWGHNAGGG